MNIVEVSTKKEMALFIDYPNELYQHCEFYVPPVYGEVKKMLSRQNPFFAHSQMQLFLVYDKDKILGRIAAIFNKTHLDTYHDSTGFFGFFDSINDTRVSSMLFNAAEQWLKARGITKIAGPTNITTNDSCGILSKGFNLPPAILMPYNYDYYENLISSYGFSKKIALFSYAISGSKILSEFPNIYDKAVQYMNNNGIIIRNLTKNTFQEDIEKLNSVYNESNKHNWGFMPLNETEFRAMANDLKKTTPLDLTLIVEKRDQIIGFLIAVPNLNEALRYVSEGKLSLTGIYQFMKNQHKIKSARILILGLLNGYRNMGIDLVLYQKIKEALNKRKIFKSEACYVMESNKSMVSILDKLAEERLKEYQIFEKEIIYH